jgi:phospholipase C
MMIFRPPSPSIFSTIVCSSLVVLTLTGCRGLGTSSFQFAAPTVQLTAAPAIIQKGQSVTLTVAASNARAVVVSNNMDGNKFSLPSSGGTQTVHPTQTTIYTATATGSDGKTTATATSTITVADTPAVQISASPASVEKGQSTTLTVTATGASGVVITNNVDATRFALSGTGGTQTVSPTQATVYTATATGLNGTSTATATVTVPVADPPTVQISANPAAVTNGHSSTLTVTATNASAVVISNNVDATTFTLAATGGTQAVTPTQTTIYTATATGLSGVTKVTATATVTFSQTPLDITAINHIIFELQENRTFDTYLGMLNPYRAANGFTTCANGPEHCIDGIDDKLNRFSNQDDEGNSFGLFKLTSTCVDDMTSSWLESYGDVNRFDFSVNRAILMDGFVHTAENFAHDNTHPDGSPYDDLHGKRAMGYYDSDLLNYYYYMASQFALSDRWFSPISSKTVPNRIATLSGGTTEGYAYDPGVDDKLPQLQAKTIFQALDEKGVSWKIYYTTKDPDGLPQSAFTLFGYANRYLRRNPDGTIFIDPTHVVPTSQFLADATAGTLPSFAFIEAGFGENDEHPSFAQSILHGQQQVASLINGLMNSPSWKDSVFFFSYDEGGGPFDHVPPVPGHTNDFTDKNLGITTDIKSIAVNPDDFNPCPAVGKPPLSPGSHCDLNSVANGDSQDDPGIKPNDAAKREGFAAQLGFRVPNFIVSPFVKKGFVGHTPMDHTAIMKFIETRFGLAPLTRRDATQPDLLEFFDFVNVPWATPPTPPAPVDHGQFDPACRPDKLQ